MAGFGWESADLGMFPEDKVHLPSTETGSCSHLLFISCIQHLGGKTLGTGFAKGISFPSNLSCPLNLPKESMAGAALHPTALQHLKIREVSLVSYVLLLSG